MSNMFKGKYFIFLAIVLGLIHSSFVLAEEENIGDKPTKTECEDQMILAFSEADYQFQTNYQDYLNLPDITSVAKSTEGNIESYINTYKCHLKTICSAVQNIATSGIEGKIKFPLNECNLNGKNEFTIQDVGKYFKADFAKCTFSQRDTYQRVYQRCETVANIKRNLTNIEAESEYIKNTHLENNSFMALKMVDINTKLDALLEKVKNLVIHFKKVNDDISCVNPDSSGLQ